MITRTDDRQRSTALEVADGCCHGGGASGAEVHVPPQCFTQLAARRAPRGDLPLHSQPGQQLQNQLHTLRSTYRITSQLPGSGLGREKRQNMHMV